MEGMEDLLVAAETRTSSKSRAKVRPRGSGSIWREPYVILVIGGVKAAAVAIVMYAILHGATWGMETIERYIPTSHSEPLDFFSEAIAWAKVLAAGFSLILILIYEWIDVCRILWASIRHSDE